MTAAMLLIGMPRIHRSTLLTAGNPPAALISRTLNFPANSVGCRGGIVK